MQINCLMYMYGLISGRLLTLAVTYFFTRDVCQKELVKVQMELDQQKKTQGIQFEGGLSYNSE